MAIFESERQKADAAKSAWELRVLNHLCRARNCTMKVPPSMFMCKPHWFQLPKQLRDAIWAAYVPGQEKRMDPNDDYLRAAQEAVEWLASRESS